MASGRRCGAAALLLALALSPLSCRRVEADRLYALPGAADGRDGVVLALPLRLKAGGGNVSGGAGRFGDLEVDTDAVHKVSASCHHGPPITNPLPLEVRAAYDESRVYVEVTWRDATPDRTPRAWEREGAAWRLGGGDEDGVAILWSRGGGRFGCQEACHMSDFAVREGAVIDLRAMRLAEPGAFQEAWVWKAAAGAAELFLGNDGFVTAPGGPAYRTLNSAIMADESLRPGARHAGAFGPDDRPLWDAAGSPLEPGATRAPAYRYAAPGEAPLLDARAQRMTRGWRVVFSRPLAGGSGRQEFRPGERYRFGLALFDSTSTDHHLVRDAQVLELVVPAPAPKAAGGADDEKGVL